MIRRSRKPRRHGSVMVEAALVYTILALFLVGSMTLALGVCAIQELGALAREGARWASVHGGQYQAVTGNAMATPSSTYSNAIQPLMAGINSSDLITPIGFSWLNAGGMPTNGNTVTVTLTYKWYPAGFANLITGSKTGYVTLTATSVMPVCF